MELPRLEDVAVPLISPVHDGPVDLIPGLVPSAGQCIIAGQTNQGKSLLALEIVSSLITGNLLWGELRPTRTIKKALYVLGEHYREVIQRLWSVTRLPMTDQVWLLGPEELGWDKWLVVGGKPNGAAFKKFESWVKDCDLIIFDPLAAFVSGVDAENDNLQMRLVLDTMSLIAQNAGASCIILAHQGKPGMDQQGREYSRKSYAIRGASAIEDAATNIFYLAPGEKGDSDVGKHGEGQMFDLIKRKYKGEAPDRFRLLRDRNTLTHTLLGNRPYVEVRRTQTSAKVATLQAAMPQLSFADCIQAVAAYEGLSAETVRRYLGGSKRELIESL